MIMWQRVRVRAHLAKLNVIANDSCPMCHASETIEHVFFDCTYSFQCMSLLENKLQFQLKPQNLTDCNSKLMNISGRFKRQVIQSCYANLLYTTWRQRNSAIWNQCLQSPEKAFTEILYEVYHRISYIMSQKVRRQNKEWIKCLLS